jgi:hypothetical protein
MVGSYCYNRLLGFYGFVLVEELFYETSLLYLMLNPDTGRVGWTAEQYIEVVHEA